MERLLATVHLAGFAACLFVVALLLAHDRRSPANRALRLLLTCGALWSLLELFLYVPASVGLEVETLRLAGVFHLSGPFCFCNFAYALAERRRGAAWRALGAATLALIGLYLFTDLGVASAIRGPAGGARSAGRFQWYFDVAEGLGHAYALWVVFRAYALEREPALRRAFLSICVGVVVADAVGVIAELVADPWTTGFSVRSVGVPAFIPFLGAAITRHGLLSADVSKAAAELFADAKDGVVILDRYDRIRQVNGAALRMLEPGPEDLLGRRAAEVAPMWSEIVVRDRGEMEMDGRAGSARRLAVSWSTPVRRGQRLGRIFLVRDVTKKAQAAEALARSREDLEGEVERRSAELRVAQRAEALGELTGSIAHDFNNILAAIIGFATAARDDLPEHHATRRDVEEILAAARRARGTVDQLLVLGQRGAARRAPIELGEFLETTVSFVRSSLPVTISLEYFPPPGKMFVMGEPTQLRQVGINLATSAAQAFGAVGGKMTVRVSAANAGGAGGWRGTLEPDETAVIEVTDDGPEIDRELLGALFDPFGSRGPRSGTGLGLPIAQRIVRDHGGAITVESGGGKGTTFSIHLPLISPQAAAALGETPLDTGSERILLIDGNPESSREARRTLVSLGYRVTELPDPLDAVAEFRRKPGAFDAAIVQVELPGSSGLDVAAEILEERPGAPILLVAAHAGAGTMRSAERLGIAGLLQKPVSPGDLSAAIRRAIDGAAGRSSRSGTA